MQFEIYFHFQNYIFLFLNACPYIPPKPIGGVAHSDSDTCNVDVMSDASRHVALPPKSKPPTRS